MYHWGYGMSRDLTGKDLGILLPHGLFVFPTLILITTTLCVVRISVHGLPVMFKGAARLFVHHVYGAPLIILVGAPVAVIFGIPGSEF